MVFRGTFDYTLDAKNRLTVPAKVRTHFADGAVLARGLRKHVALWIPQEFDAYVAEMLGGFHKMSDEYATLDSHLNGGSHPVELDSAGRIPLPPRLMQYAGISKDVVIVGSTDSLQLWDRSTWDVREDGLTDAVNAITARLSGSGPTLPTLGQP